MPKWFLQMPRPPRIAKRTAVLVFGLGAALAATSFAPLAQAGDTAPDWLRAAAQQTVPDYPKDTDAVILLDETQTTVQDNGEIYTRHRRAVRLLRPEARREFSDIAVDFDKDTKIVSLKAWTIQADGKEIAVGEKDAVEQGFFDNSEYQDVRVKTLLIPEAYPGNVVGYEYVQKKRPYIFEDDWGFQRTVPVLTARFILQIPASWKFTSNWFNHPEIRPQTTAANQYVWEVQNLPAIDVEPEMPAWRSIAGWAGFKYFPSDPALRAKTSGTWTDIGLWYDTLTASSRIASPEIKQKVAELTAGMSDPVQRMRAITNYMQRSIRYYAVEIGIGGYQPHPAAEVFTHQYGDCKDKATLLSSMLHEIGIDSYYVVIDTDRNEVHPAYPSMDFDHVILAIRLPDSVTDNSLYAVINDPKLGRLLIFDPTNEYVPLGYIPYYLQDSYALLVAPDGGRLISMPLLAPSTNRLLREATLTLSPTGDLSGEIQEIRWGAPASRDREEFLETQPSKRAEVFEHFLGQFLPNFTLTGASLGNLDQYDRTLSLDYKFVSQGYAKSAGDLLLVSPRVVGDQYTGMLDLFTIDGKPRKYAIEFDEATRQDDLFNIKLPAGYAVDGLPQPVQASCDYATYHSEMKVADGVLHYKRTFEVKDVIVPTEKLPELRAFLQQVAADQSSGAVLRRVTP